MQKQNAKTKKYESSDDEEEEGDDDNLDEKVENVEEEKDEDEDEEEMDEEESKDDDPLKSIKGFKAIVVKALIDNEMDQKRACKMEIIDFLNLLKIFNDIGVHFK